MCLQYDSVCGSHHEDSQVTTEGKSFPTCVTWPSHWCGFSSRLVVQSYSRIFSDILREHLMRSLWICMQHVRLLLSPNFFLKKLQKYGFPFVWTLWDLLFQTGVPFGSYRWEVRTFSSLQACCCGRSEKTEKYMIKNTNLDKYSLNEIWGPVVLHTVLFAKLTMKPLCE